MGNQATLNLSASRLRAAFQLGDNGTGAKSAPVKIVARSGDPIEHPYWGRIVHDFAGMTVAPKIPLDYAHDCENSIGYLNRFDTSTGDLVCSGAIVPFADDKGAEVIAKVAGGVPYEASIQFGDEYTMEIVPESVMTQVNGREVVGPCVVIRQWELEAVAVCKEGADENTSTELAFSDKPSKQIKGMWLRATKEKGMQQRTEDKSVETVEAAPEAKAVEVVAEVEQPTQLSAVKAEAEGVAPQAVEAVKPTEAVAAEVVAEAVKVDATTVLAKPTTEVANPRDEARKFIDTFGELAGVKYFAAGKSFDEALAEHLKFQASQIDDLSKRLLSIDRGAPKPVAFKDVEAENEKTAKTFIRLRDKAK